MKQIHILQKQAIRLIDNSKATSHSDPLFLKYKILKINDLLSVSLALGLTCTQASLALSTLALSTLAIQPHFLSGQFAIRPHLISKRLLSSLNCYQCSSAIQNQLLSKYVAIKISCFINKLLSKPAISCYQKLVFFLNKLLSKLVLICYHKLVSWSISCYQNQSLFAIKNLFFFNKYLSKLVLI